jgi:ribosomal protein S2
LGNDKNFNIQQKISSYQRLKEELHDELEKLNKRKKGGSKKKKKKLLAELEKVEEKLFHVLALAEAEAQADSESTSTANFEDNTITAEAGGNTLTTGNNNNIIVNDSAATSIAVSLSTLSLFEALRSNGNTDSLGPVISNLSNTLEMLMQQGNDNRRALLDAINSLNNNNNNNNNNE